MTMQEMSRLILGLRMLGLTDTEMGDFLLWVGSGERKYEPKPIREPEKAQ